MVHLFKNILKQFFSIELKGSITIAGSLDYTKKDDTDLDNEQDELNLTVNQTQQFTLGAFIGDKLEITANQNSESDFGTPSASRKKINDVKMTKPNQFTEIDLVAKPR